jgi:hypothetical protein
MTCGRLVVFSGYSGSSTNKTDLHDITEILLKVALATSNPVGRKKVIAVFIVSLYIHDLRSPIIGFPQISHDVTHQLRGASERSDFNQIV